MSKNPAMLVCRLLRLLGIVMTLPFTGCGSDHELLRVDIRTVIPYQHWPSATGRTPRVAVAPLIDARSTAHRWHYHRNFSGVLPITTSGHLGELTSLAAIDYLSRREGWIAWIEKEGVAPPTEPAEYRLSGRILLGT